MNQRKCLRNWESTQRELIHTSLQARTFATIASGKSVQMLQPIRRIHLQ